jgi:hypothetical protein
MTRLRLECRRYLGSITDYPKHPERDGARSVYYVKNTPGYRGRDMKLTTEQ